MLRARCNLAGENGGKLRSRSVREVCVQVRGCIFGCNVFEVEITVGGGYEEKYYLNI